MGCILIGLILCALLFWWAINSMSRGASDGYLRLFLAVMCLLTGIGFGLFAPLSGFHDFEETSAIELVSLSDQTISTGEGLIYVSIIGENSYTYYVEVDNKFGDSSTKSYKSKTISGNNITIVEGDNCEGATLVTYTADGKKSFWTFALASSETEYVFYVPTGTISRSVSLG